MSKDSNELSESVPEYLRPGPELDLERMPVGSALEYLHPGPKPGLEPMPVDDYVITIANLMKPEAEKKLGTTFTTYTPLFYILKGGINYCIRVEVQNGLIDVKGRSAVGKVRNVKARRVTEDVQMEFF